MRAAAPARFPLRFRHDRQFHVSPFNDMRGHYEFSLSELGPDMRLAIDLVRDGVDLWRRGGAGISV